MSGVGCRVSAVEKKREKILEQLQEIREEKVEVDEDLQRLNKDLEQLQVNGQRPTTEAQFKQYMREMNRKASKYKEKKELLRNAKAEVNVLLRTEEILRTRDKNIQDFNHQLEREKGVEGYQATQDNLEQVCCLLSSSSPPSPPFVFYVSPGNHHLRCR